MSVASLEEPILYAFQDTLVNGKEHPEIFAFQYKNKTKTITNDLHVFEGI